jgi:hypothetical protein
MNEQLSLEKRRDLLQNRLYENLQKKHALELRINHEFEELKSLEISLEKHSDQRHAVKQIGVEH